MTPTNTHGPKDTDTNRQGVSSAATHAFENDVEAHTAAGADRSLAPEEELSDVGHNIDVDVAKHFEEMNKIGASVQGEGAIETPSD